MWDLGAAAASERRFDPTWEYSWAAGSNIWHYARVVARSNFAVPIEDVMLQPARWQE